MSEETGMSSLPMGRGRGRGRGAGVPVLPEGLWGELSGLGTDTGEDNSKPQESDSPTYRDHEPDFRDKFEDKSTMPTSFGRGRGAGRGRGQGGNMKTIEKDMKGTDWTCPSCSNTNWSWRASCNRCQTFKPVSALAESKEVRDGAGGGFNERQSRVSATNVEITEDGFDDFGRRAKGRAEDKKAKEAAALARLQSNYGFLLNPEALISAGSNGAKVDIASTAVTESSRRDGDKKRASSDRRDDRRRSRSRERSKDRDRRRDDRPRDRDSNRRHGADQRGYDSRDSRGDDRDSDRRNRRDEYDRRR